MFKHVRLILPLETTPAGDPIYETTAELTIQGFVIPAGTRTDLASTPKWVQDRLPPDGPWSPAAILHDWLYVNRPLVPDQWAPPPATWNNLTRPITRAEADGYFLAEMKRLGVPVRQRFPMWAAVRLFGGNAWRCRLGWAPGD